MDSTGKLTLKGSTALNNTLSGGGYLHVAASPKTPFNVFRQVYACGY